VNDLPLFRPHRVSISAVVLLAGALLSLSRCHSASEAPKPAPPPGPASSNPSTTPAGSPSEGVLSPLSYPGERHLANIRQLTFGGENAEAYWSEDGKQLIFQSTRPPFDCDQIFVLDVDRPETAPRLVSTGKGRTTCAYFIPKSDRIVYSSTHLGSARCPTPPDQSHGYVWGLFPDFDIFSSKADGTDVERMTATPGYDAEATVSTDGRKIVFTSVRDGDLEIYTMASDGSNVRRITNRPGYDGGPFFSDDGEWIVYRNSEPKTEAALLDFRALLAKGLIRPTTLEIRVMRSDGSDDRPVTSNGAANFAPFFFRGGHDRIVFCSNLADPKKRNFDLWTVRSDGTGLERITYNPTFDGFPMFSPDGKRLAFCSNRHNAKPGETNVFVADWVP
jgi:Tol biopolymer transport system component